MKIFDTCKKEQMMGNKRFRLLHGGHVGTNDSLVQEDGTLIPCMEKHKVGGVERTRIRVNDGRGFEPGDVIESPNDLTMFNSPGSVKFEEIHEASGPPQRTTDYDKLYKALKRMTVDALRGYAEDEEIDLGDASKKDEIINKIVESYTVLA